MMRDMALLVLFFAVITAPMLWHVTRAGPLLFTGCSKITCESATMDDHHGTTLAVSQVSLIGNSSDCPGKCSDIISGATSAHVMGHHLDIQCQAWGGDFCQHKEAQERND